VTVKNGGPILTNFLVQYYQGIAQRLRSEVDIINELLDHQGLKGEGNEAILRDLIKRFIPNKFGVGTGVVIDHTGKQSKQCDIVIYTRPSFSVSSSQYEGPRDGSRDGLSLSRWLMWPIRRALSIFLLLASASKLHSFN